MFTKNTSNQKYYAPNLESRNAIVIGAGFGGLAAAMRLLAKGYRVKVFEKNLELGGRGSSMARSGYRFDLGPTIITLPNMFRELWSVCGRNFDDDVVLKPLEEFYSLKFWDGTSLTISHDYTKVLEQVRNLSPMDQKGFERFLVDAGKRYSVAFEHSKTMGREPMNKRWATIRMLPLFAFLRADRSVYAHAASRVKDPRMRFALSFHPLFVGANPFNVTSMWGIVSHIEKEFGISTAIGGFSAIAEAMGKVIRDMGGEIHLGTEIKHINVNDGMVNGVLLSSGNVVNANIVVSNADPMTTYCDLASKIQKRWWSTENLSNKRWSMGLFVWHFGTKGTSKMWRNVGQHTILQGPDYQGEVENIFLKGGLEEEMSLYVHRPTRNDQTAAPPGDDTFYALACVPNLKVNPNFDWEKEGEAYKNKVLSILERRLLPGLSKSVVESYYMTPLDFQDRYRSPFGAGFSMEPQMFQSAWFRPHNISEEIKGLFLVGAGTHPGPGVPGVLASAEVLGKLVPDLQLNAREYESSLFEGHNSVERVAAE